MGRNAAYLLVLLFVFSGCSTEDPPFSFVTSNMRIVKPGTNGSETELLRMKPMDLNKAFDINVKKKWEKVQDTSWLLNIEGKDPATKVRTTYLFTLTPDPFLKFDAVIRKVVINGKELDEHEVADIMRKLDRAYFTQK
ncbi:hypothetical protein LLG96_01635 [bacterium]|nr:hypothetical protein [bacterium]